MILLFILLVLFLNIITICKSMILHNTHMIFASTFLASYLFVTHPCFFFFHQVVRKLLKFINNVLQTNESFLSESNFPSFLSLCAFILGHLFGKMFQQFPYKYLYHSILIFLVISLGMIPIKYNSFDTDIGSQMM